MLKLHKIVRVMLTLVIAVALGGFLPFSTTNVLANPGYGTITGNIYEEATGNPLYPATIRVENYSTGELVGEFSNYPDGSFHIVAEEGIYRLGASASGFVATWYPNNCTQEEATSVTVTLDGTVSDISFNLQQGGSITGTVRNQWDGTEQNQVVIAWTADTQELIAWAFSNDYDNYGQYSLEELPYGDYKVSAGGPLPEGVEDPENRNQNLIKGWWSPEGTVTSAGAAGVITIEAPTPVEGINIQLEEGGQLEGRITDENWNGLNEATITLENYDSGEVLAVATSYNRDGVDPGYFRFSGLSSDVDYCVWATATNRVIRYSRESCSGTYDRDDATSYQIEPGWNYWVSDINLPYGGSLSGNVYQSDGVTPIEGATVVVESWDSSGENWVRIEKLTIADGGYTVPGIPLGSYLVSALGIGFTIEYYAAAGSVATPDLAEEVILSPGQVDITGLDFSLDAGGTISGTVSNESGQLLDGAEVCAVPVIDGGEGYGEGPESPFHTATNSNGEYTIAGLPFDNYKVCAEGGDNPQYVSEWYDDQISYETASTVSLSAESPDATGIAFSLAIGGSITGVVMPDGGDPWLNDARVTVYDYDTGEMIAEEGTLEDNMTYLIQGIPTGSYLVVAEAQDRALKFWQDTYSEAEATPVQVTAPGVTLNINFNLSPGGRMNGRVWMSGEYGGHEILPGALVTASLLNPVDTPDEDFEDMEFTANTNENGDWELGHLPYGDYKIGASGGEGQMVIPKWWSDYGEAYSWDEAGIITLDYNWGWWAEFWLNPAGLVTGVVNEGDGTTPIANAEVFALERYGGSGGEDSIIGSTTTDTNGSYELFCPTDQGSFIIGAQAEGCVRMFFQNTFDPSEAVNFLLEVGEEVGGVNFSLEPAGTISGTVSDASTSEGLTGCVVLAMNESTGVDFKTPVNEDGTYTVDNLPFGEYIVMAMGMPEDLTTSNYAMEWWQETASHEGATPVAVNATTAYVTGINFTLEPGGAIEGIIRHENGWDINGALVTLYLPDGTQLATTWSNGWEGYKFNGVPSGEYKISAWYVDPQGGSNTQRRFYNDKNSLEEADLVTVTAPDIVSGIDFSLPQANGQISGLVLYTGSLQSNDYEQVVVIARPHEVDVPPEMLYETSISAPGSYQMSNIADGSYIVIAFLDIDGDFQPDAGEPYGFYGDPTPVALASTPENPYPQAPGTTIIITDEAQGIIMGYVSLEGADDDSGATVTAGGYQTTTGQDGSYILNAAPGTYTVTIDKAGYLTAVSPEIYVVEILSGEPVEMPDTLLLRGDIDGNGAIDIADLVSVAENLGTTGPTGDLTEDGVVDILDLVPIGRNFGETESLWLDDGESGPELPAASGTPSFILDPPTQSVAPGETVAVNMVIEGVDGLYAAEFHLNFDETLLEVQDVNATTSGNQIAPSDDLFPLVSGAYHSAGGENLYHYSYSAESGGYFIAQCEADNSLGEIDYTIVLLSPEGEASATPVSADPDGAVVATITFSCLDEGEASVDFTTSPKLADAAGDSIAGDIINGTIITIQIPPPEVSDVNISNVGNLSFTVSWVTNVDTTGQISYGTSPDNLSGTAYDDRGQATEDDTHHVTITGLTASTPYYFDVISAETTDDDSGAHYGITTGPGLDFKMPDPITGTVYKSDGATAAEGSIVYASIGTSQVLSALVDSSGNWGVDIAAIRTADYQGYYSYADGDDISVDAQGGADGTISQTVTVATAKAGAPAMTLVPNYAPTVENVTASQDTGAGTVSIEYDVYDQDEDDTSVEVSFAYWNGSAYVDCATVTGDGTKTVATSATHYTATWDAKTDSDDQYITDAKIKVIADDGNILGTGEGTSAEFILDTEGPTGIACSLPENEATDVELTPTLTAVEATDLSTPVSYYFTIATDQNFGAGVQESGWLSENTWIPSTRLQAPEVDYWWKVEAKDNFGNISESTAFKLTTLAVVPVDVGLVDGWNIVALAVEPVEGYTASTLAAAINDQGGNITQVFWWNAAAGSWDFYLVSMAYGTDFDIEVGYGYLLKNTTPATWTYWGVPLSAEYSATVEPQVNNVGNMSFTVTWVSPEAEVGSVSYGTSAGSLDSTAYDDRGQATEDDAHHVTITGLTASTPYYYEIICGGTTYNDGGVPYEMTTGPGLDFKMPDPITGTAYKTGGVTAAEGAIVYVSIGTSQTLSVLVDSSGAWGIDIAAIRAVDYQSYYTHADSDNISIEAQGAADGIDTQTVTIAMAKDGAPAMEVSIAAELSLVDGWNLAALPVEPATSYTASTMAAEINNQSGNITQVFWWNAAAGSWDFYLVDMQYGTDFSIELGEGYLLKSTTASTWTVPSS